VSGYLGSFVHQVDAKGRVALPASFRRGSELESFILVQVHEDALSLFPHSSWRPVEEELRELIRKQPEARASVLALTASALEVSTDKQGRILIPDRMRELVGLRREALFVGALNKIEIWDPKRFRDSTEAPDPKFDPFIESIFA
jgi:MraZ protein